VQGLAAISAHDGWSMAIVGACIVMTGLSVLSFIISQLHKIVGMIEKRTQKPAPEEIVSETESTPDLFGDEKNILDDLTAVVEICMPLSAELGDTFELATLYQIFDKANLPHPHLTIRALRDAGYLASAGEGSFCWKQAQA
jgi:hypothetical protein